MSVIDFFRGSADQVFSILEYYYISLIFLDGREVRVDNWRVWVLKAGFILKDY